MDMTKMISYYEGEVHRSIADLHQGLTKKIVSITRENSARGLSICGAFAAPIVKAHVEFLGDAMKTIFAKTREVVLEFGVDFDDAFSEKMCELLDEYYDSLSRTDSLDRYFEGFGVLPSRVYRADAYVLEATKLKVWYKNNIESFNFKLRNEIETMERERNTKQGLVVNAYKSSVVHAVNSNVQIGQNVSSYNEDAITAIDSVLEYLQGNKVLDGKAEQDDLVAALEGAKEEVEKEKPSKLKVTSILDGVGKIIGQVPQFVSAVEAVRKMFT